MTSVSRNERSEPPGWDRGRQMLLLLQEQEEPEGTWVIRFRGRRYEASRSGVLGIRHRVRFFVFFFTFTFTKWILSAEDARQADKGQAQGRGSRGGRMADHDGE